jgi:hypothetical protein
MNKWELKSELINLCAKCAGLKPSTAKSYARKFFDKSTETDDSCISWYTVRHWNEKTKEVQKLTQALNTLKHGLIKSDTCILKLEDVSYVDFKEDVTEITTKSGKVIKYGKGFEYLEYVFKYNNRDL